MTAIDQDRLSALMLRLREFELRLPLPHERSVVEVAKAALVEQIERLAHSLHDLDYWRPVPARVSAAG